ncbi:GntR family transcriptional regulator [Agrobacterium arsenijevicii]|uniref:GntR family transcriptional regulator n=1 Tax=Agrobacterium arsenijevicii TaxID=1585697 RepID=UPI0005D42318
MDPLASLKLLTLPKPRTVADDVADAIRAAIIDGTLPPDKTLRQDELATRFGFSRMPIRDALRQLESEGLVSIHPTKGAHVARLDETELKEIYGLRSILEAEAMRLSCPNLDEAQISVADAILRQMDAENDFGQLGALNRKFHLALYRQCGNGRLISLIDTYLAAADRYVRVLLSVADYQAQSQSDHRDILDACKQGNAQKASTATRRHIDAGCRALFVALGRYRGSR